MLGMIRSDRIAVSPQARVAALFGWVRAGWSQARFGTRPVMALLAALLAMLLVAGGAPAAAETLGERVTAFPNWHHQPDLKAASGDLAYPDWLSGTWKLESTLVEMIAPLEPTIVTPGFESNREYLNEPVTIKVRFAPKTVAMANPTGIPVQAFQTVVVADRAFNGLNIAKAYMGPTAVKDVLVDPLDPNRQITLLKNNRQLLSIITARGVEQPDDGHFITAERFQQVFRGQASPYLNQVETTTSYERQADGVTADQITAIYLSPQDPKYFEAGDEPVALYRYKLKFSSQKR
jgi:hypothetical protein